MDANKWDKVVFWFSMVGFVCYLVAVYYGLDFGGDK